MFIWRANLGLNGTWLGLFSILNGVYLAADIMEYFVSPVKPHSYPYSLLFTPSSIDHTTIERMESHFLIAIRDTAPPIQIKHRPIYFSPSPFTHAPNTSYISTSTTVKTK